MIIKYPSVAVEGVDEVGGKFIPGEVHVQVAAHRNLEVAGNDSFDEL